MMTAVSFLLFIGLSSSGFAATLVYNIHGYTMDHGMRMSFAAMEYDKGKVTHLYENDKDIAVSKAAERIDGKGATLLPGLIDAHGHIPDLGLALSVIDLVGSKSEAAAVQRTRDFLLKSPNEKWIYGRGWNQVLWPGKAFPNHKSLDAVSAITPIVLERIDGHAVWVNNAALQLAGISNETPDPEGGQIIRDDDGLATGVLVDNAADLIFAVQPPVSDQQVISYELNAMRNLVSVGLTSVHDAGATAQEMRGYQSLQSTHSMPVRVYAMLWMLDPDNDFYLNQGPIIDPEHMLDIRSVKLQIDGALGSRGAALFSDYRDSPGHKGLLLLNDEQMERHIGRAMKAGYQVNTHAIGDLANTKVLNFYERLIAKFKSAGLRHRIEHSQILRVADIPRFKANGIIASIEPTHATSDKNMAGDRLGEDRLAGAYVWKSLRDSGAAMAGGSDFPIEPPNPFYGLHAAVTRQSRDNQPLGGWMAEQKLSRDVSLSLFTEDAAYAAHQENVVGRLLPGYYADFILVEDDYFTVPEQQIWKNKVLATYVAGKQVFGANNAGR
ncbi:MAG: putative amidohydrolase YtcJ [Halioglobus sp.]|jgi:predicted amidohydrolase YtcJ